MDVRLFGEVLLTLFVIIDPPGMLPICVAYDHRLIDGADGARFTNEIVKVLEDFQAMFLGL